MSIPAPGYRPLTATPFRNCRTYSEIEPCPALRPYVRCFWGGQKRASDIADSPWEGLVIPDTCADVIYTVDYTAQMVAACFCGVNDRAFLASLHRGGHTVSVFAVRFYAWGAYAFSEDSLAGTLNTASDARQRFDWLDKPLRACLPALSALPEQARFAQTLLLKRLKAVRHSAVVEDAVRQILLHRGACEVRDLSREVFVSERHLERLFHEYIGITPKKLSGLIRYQSLWGDIVRRAPFNLLDAVQRYGYTDAAHLMREFRRYHSMNIRAACALAMDVTTTEAAGNL